jgi:hypothetical protein
MVDQEYEFPHRAIRVIYAVGAASALYLSWVYVV